MKLIFLSSILALSSNWISAQNYYEISFEGTGLYEFDNRHELVVEPAGLWQVGSPDKTIFTEAFTLPNAIVTDTANSYPVNANSSFVLKHVANSGFDMPNLVQFGGKYRVDSDSLTDYGTIEFSPDNGTTWIDLINQGQYDEFIDWGNANPNETGIPVLTGNSNGWKDFSVYLEQLATVLPINGGDTVLFKFSFISDAADNARDGLMFDSLFMWDTPPVGLDEYDSGNQLTIYPNPASSTIKLNYSTHENAQMTVKVYNYLGVKIDEFELSENHSDDLTISRYANGFYTIVLSDSEGNRQQTGVFVKQDN
ncbi:MAG: T9SS type A sorting domain-containing protein [Bacteroidota bacterium]